MCQCFRARKIPSGMNVPTGEDGGNFKPNPMFESAHSEGVIIKTPTEGPNQQMSENDLVIESLVLRELHHPNIVGILGGGQTHTGARYAGRALHGRGREGNTTRRKELSGAAAGLFFFLLQFSSFRYHRKCVLAPLLLPFRRRFSNAGGPREQNIDRAWPLWLLFSAALFAVGHSALRFWRQKAALRFRPSLRLCGLDDFALLRIVERKANERSKRPVFVQSAPAYLHQASQRTTSDQPGNHHSPRADCVVCAVS